MEIQEARGAHALDALKDDWNALIERSDRATIYQTWDWNEVWWRTFHRRKRLFVLEARENGRLIGIAPLYVSRHLGTPLRRLAFIGTGSSDYLDVIAEDARAEEVCSAFLRYLGASRMFDLADLQQMRPAAHLRTTAESVHARRIVQQGWTLIPQEPCPYVALPSSWEEFAARLGKKMRSNLSYYDRQLGKHFAHVETGLASRENLDGSMEALFDLHQKRWNARFLPGALGTARVQMFHRRVAERFHERGWLRLHTTRVDGRDVASLYCYRFRERYYYYLGGFAPDLARYSLGTVLTAHAIRQAIAEGCREFDFLRGGEPYKYRWMPEERHNIRLLLPRHDSLRSHALVGLNQLERYVEHRAKEFAERRGRSGTA